MANEDSVLSFKIASEDIPEIQNLIRRGYFSTISEFAMDSIRTYLSTMHILVEDISNEYKGDQGDFSSYLKSRIQEIFYNQCPIGPEKAASRDKGMQVTLNVTEDVKTALIDVDKATLSLKKFQKIGMFAVYWNICQMYSLFSVMLENKSTIDEIIKKKDQEAYEIPDRYRGSRPVWRRVEE